MLDYLEMGIDQHLDDMETTEEKLETARVAEDVAAIGAQDHGHAEKTELLEVVDADAVGYASPDSV